jgi:8-oxo-dGTP pyrophosphatase MutT (NUDIX family)
MSRVPVANSDISLAVASYLARHPGDEEVLAPLLAELADGTDLTSPSALPGHVTCSAVAVNERGLMLVIWHRTLGLWLQPGGHVDPVDDSLVGAARRELAEETGVTVSLPGREDGQLPLDIHVGAVPANPVRNMAAHWHADFMYLFRVRDPVIQLQLAEVSDYDWRPPQDVYGRRLVERMDSA